MIQIRKEFIIILVFFVIGLSIYLLVPIQSVNFNSYKINNNNNNNNNNSNFNGNNNSNKNNDNNNNFSDLPTKYTSHNPVTNTPSIVSNDPTKPMYYIKEVLGVNNNGKRSEFAYSFYITRDEYFCAALITAQNIRKYSIMDIVIHLVEYEYSEIIMNNFLHVPNVYLRFVKNVEPQNGDKSSFWAQTWNKFYVFKLTDYQRVIHLDADTYLLKGLDHLFDLPDATLALPRAYWLGQPFATSLLMVLKPSDKLYDDIISHGNTNNYRGNSWDMDVLNSMFKNSPDFIMLPGIYGLLHGEFSTNEKHWLGDNYHETWEKAPLFHWSTWKPWKESENSERVNGGGDLFKKTWTLWNEGVNNFCRKYNK